MYKEPSEPMLLENNQTLITDWQEQHPCPVDHKTYSQSIELLAKAINRTKLGIGEKREAMGRLMLPMVG